MPSQASPGHCLILYFAAASSFTRKSSQEFPAPTKFLDLLKALEQAYPGIHKDVLSTSALTVNLEYVDLEEISAGSAPNLNINEGDEVAIIPPVSSG